MGPFPFFVRKNESIFTEWLPENAFEAKKNLMFKDEIDSRQLTEWFHRLKPEAVASDTRFILLKPTLTQLRFSLKRKFDLFKGKKNQLLNKRN